MSIGRMWIRSWATGNTLDSFSGLVSSSDGIGCGWQRSLDWSEIWKCGAEPINRSELNMIVHLIRRSLIHRLNCISPPVIQYLISLSSSALLQILFSQLAIVRWKSLGHWIVPDLLDRQLIPWEGTNGICRA
jgi:hypothetical protein